MFDTIAAWKKWEWLVSLSLFCLFPTAETFGGEIAQQGDWVQEETAGNCWAQSRICSSATDRGHSEAETRGHPAETGNLCLHHVRPAKYKTRSKWKELHLISFHIPNPFGSLSRSSFTEDLTLSPGLRVHTVGVNINVVEASWNWLHTLYVLPAPDLMAGCSDECWAAISDSCICCCSSFCTSHSTFVPVAFGLIL